MRLQQDTLVNNNNSNSTITGNNHMKQLTGIEQKVTQKEKKTLTFTNDETCHKSNDSIDDAGSVINALCVICCTVATSNRLNGNVAGLEPFLQLLVGYSLVRYKAF